MLRTTFKKLTLKVSGSTINFKGCNTINFTYLASSDGTIKFTKGSSTYSYCRDDYDDYYVRALQSSVKYTDMKGMYTFYDAKGQSILTFVLIQADPIPTGSSSSSGSGTTVTTTITNSSSTTVPPPVGSYFSSSANTTSSNIYSPSAPLNNDTQTIIANLTGKYKILLPDFNLQVLDNSLIYKGCNSYRFPCTFQSLNVFFGNPIISNKDCQDDSKAEIDQYLLNLIPKILTFKR